MKSRIVSILFTMSMSGLLLLTVFLTLPSTLKANVTATTYLVPQDFPTIQEAVNNATDGDTISISAGVYTENITITVKTLTLVGIDKETTIIDGNAISQALTISDDAKVTINSLTIRNGYGTYGGGISAQGSQVTISNVLLINNTFDFMSNLGSGAAISAVDTDVTISNSQLISNTSSGGSGAIYFQANLQPSALAIYHTQILSNSTSGFGGGIRIFNNATAPSPLISHSTIAYNSALAGGGIAVNGTGTPAPLKIINSTISNNEGSSFGGGLLVFSEAQLTQTTVVNNQPSGIHLGSANLILNSSIVANNSGTDCNPAGTSSISSTGYNIASDNSCQLNLGSDLPNSDPLVGLLQDNGGATWTHALLSNSPALGAAVGCTVDDQRGRPRAMASCDIGAYEAQPYANDDLLLTSAPLISVAVDVLANDLPGLTGTFNLESVAQPVNGVASIVNQQVVYTPTAGFVGTEVMTYTISDDVVTSTARLTVIVDGRLYLPLVIR